ncbi:MAG TPA: class I SAM-dependent methyltransferase [Chryseosolibacter sp.]
MKSSSEKFYDQFSFLYPAIDWILKPQKKKLFEKINACPCGQLLEIGIGNGSNLKYYRSHRVTGIDTSRRMLTQARKQAGTNVELFHMNGEKLFFSNESFDYVVLSHVLAVVDTPGNLLAEVHRVLKPGGKVFVLNHFTPHNGLKYLDQAVQMVSRFLHLKSLFTLETVPGLQRFTLVSSSDASLFSYFKILVYEKSL